MSRLHMVTAFAFLMIVLHQPAFGLPDKPAAGPAVKLTKSGFEKVKAGMTLAEVMALLGPPAQINPDPAPFAYAAPEVLVLWKEGKDRWAGVVFTPDKQRVLRVFDAEKVGGTYKGSAALTD